MTVFRRGPVVPKGVSFSMKIKVSGLEWTRRMARVGLALLVAGMTLRATLMAMQDVWAAPQLREAPEVGAAPQVLAAQQAGVTDTVIIDCDSDTNWSPLSANSVTTDDSEYMEGMASIYLEADDGSPTWACYVPTSAWDLSDQTGIRFWFSDTVSHTRTVLLGMNNQRRYTFTSAAEWQRHSIGISSQPTNTTHVNGDPDESATFDWTDVGRICFGDQNADFRVDYVFIGDGMPVDLRASKTGSPDPVKPGGLLTYTLTITNTGVQTATGVVVTDTVPVSTTLIRPASWNRVGASREYTRSLGSLGPDVTEMLTLTVKVSDTVPAGWTVITNTAVVADDGSHFQDNDPGDNGATLTTTVDAAPDLTISKTSEDAVKPGSTITYTIIVTNAGDQGATGVVVTDTLPLSTTYQGIPPGWSHVTPTSMYTYHVGGLPASYSRTLTLTATLADPVLAGVETVTNTAEVGDDGKNGFTDTVSAEHVDDVVAAPELKISKTDPFTSVVPGQTITYTIAVTNTGNQDATGVVLTETLPVSTTWVDVSAWQPVSGTNLYTQAVGSLEGGDAVHATTFVVQVDDAPFPAGLDVITNTVSVADDRMNGFTKTVSVENENPLDAAPDLVISKTDGVTTVDPGQTVTYTLTVTNLGTQDATGVVITDTLPLSTTFNAASGGESESGGMVTWGPVAIAVGKWVTQTVSVTVDDPGIWPAGVKVISNTAQVADDGSNGADLNPDDNQASDVDDITASPDLFITKTDDTASASPGQVLVYELSYLNKGSQHASGVVITETLPDSTTYNDAESTSGWQQVGATDVYTFGVGNLSVGSGGAVDFAVTVSDTLPSGVDVISNTARIGDDGGGGVDLKPSDNTAVDEDVLTAAAAPDLVLSKDDGLDVVTAGQRITYTLTISNVGTQGATGVEVSDELPEHTTFVAASDGGGETSSGSGVVTWPTFDLPAGDAVTRTVSVRTADPIPAGVEAITNTAQVEDDGENGEDLTPGDNTAQDVDAVEAAPIVALVKTDGRLQVKPGDILTYTLTVKNVGQQNADDLVITDTLPAHTTFITASDGGMKVDGKVVWEDVDLAVGAQAERRLTAQVDTSLPPTVTKIVNAAEVAGPEGAYDSAEDEDSLLPVIDLALTKDDGEDVVVAGQPVTYTLTIINGGTGTATGIVLSDTLPASTAFVTATDGATRLGNVVTWPTFDLDRGETETRRVTVRLPEAIPAGVEAITNTASVADDGTHGPDLSPADNQAEDVNVVDAEPDLEIAKENGQDTVKPGEALTYTLTITNTGDQDAAGVVVTDTLPYYTTFLAASGDYEQPNGEVVWKDVAVPVGTPVQRTVTVRVDQALPSGVETITNKAVAAGDGLFASVEDADTVVAAPDLRVVKTDRRTGARPGEMLTYTLTVDNLGTQPASGVVLTDILPENTSFLGASDGGAETSESSGIVVWPDFSLTVDAVTTRTVTVEIAASWPTGATPVLTNTASVADDGTNGEDPVSANNTDEDVTSIWLQHIYLPLISKQ